MRPSIEPPKYTINNGTIEHNVVLEEIISQAKTNKKTVHVTFFDLEDSFG